MTGSKLEAIEQLAPGDPRETPWPLIAAVVPTALGIFALWMVARLGWPGTVVDCNEILCYCEASSPGLWRQPINTWSNVAPLIAAVAVGVQASRPSGAPVLRALGVAFAITLAFQGLGSMVFHASLLWWAGVLDGASMFLIMGLLFAINLLRAGRIGIRAVIGIWLGFTVAGVVLGIVHGAAVSPVMGVLEMAFLGTEVWLRKRGRSPSTMWFRLGLASFLVGVCVWYASAIEGMPWCDPHSVWQGHGLWHITSGAAIFMFWLHIRANLTKLAA